MFHGTDFAFSADDFSRIDHDMAFDAAVFSHHGSNGDFQFFEFVVDFDDGFPGDGREVIPDDASFSDDGAGDMGG